MNAIGFTGTVGEVVWKSLTKPMTVVAVPLGLINFLPIGSLQPKAFAAVSLITIVLASLSPSFSIFPFKSRMP